MKKIITLLLAAYLHTNTLAQSNLTNNIIEGGKTLVTLIQAFKSNKSSTVTPIVRTDSCAAKNIADISYKNNYTQAVWVSLYKRNGTIYSIQPLTLKIATGNRESLYEIPAGIYKYKIEYEDAGTRLLLHEGEIKLLPCDNLQQQIKG